MKQRLFEITYLLIERGRITAEELARHFEVSKRTIYRDIDALSLAGIPVYTEKGKGGGIRILPEFVLDKSLFSKEEQQQLVTHFQSLAALGTPDTQSVLNKLASVFGKGSDWLQIDFASWAGGEAEHRRFILLRDCILQRLVVKFEYTASTGQAEARTVEPLRILFRGQGWYLYGYSRERQDFRFFKLTRMQALLPTAEHFTRVLAHSMLEEKYTGPIMRVKLLFSHASAFRVYDEFRASDITKTADGFLVHCTMPAGDWLLGYLLSFGGELVVLEPEELRRRIKSTLAQMQKSYAP